MVHARSLIHLLTEAIKILNYDAAQDMGWVALLLSARTAGTKKLILARRFLFAARHRK
jgi:hypothetical protein